MRLAVPRYRARIVQVAVSGKAMTVTIPHGLPRNCSGILQKSIDTDCTIVYNNTSTAFYGKKE